MTETKKLLPDASEYPFWFGVDKRCVKMEPICPEDRTDPFMDAVDYVYSRFKNCFHPQHPSMLWSEISSNKWIKGDLLATLNEQYAMIIETLLVSGFIVAVIHEQSSNPQKHRIALYPLHAMKLPFYGSTEAILQYVFYDYENWWQKQSGI